MTGDWACDLCGEHVTEPRTEHQWRTVQPAACETSGNRTCLTCGTTQDIPAAGHRWSEWQWDDSGRPYRLCGGCLLREEGHTSAETAILAMGMPLMSDAGSLAYDVRLTGDCLRVTASCGERCVLAVTPAQWEQLRMLGALRLELTCGARTAVLLLEDLRDDRVSRVTEALGGLDALALTLERDGRMELSLVKGGTMVWHNGLSREWLQ